MRCFSGIALSKLKFRGTYVHYKYIYYLILGSIGVNEGEGGWL